MQRRQHGGSYLLRQVSYSCSRSTPLSQRSPLSRLGRQFSLSSDYVAAPSLLEPAYNYPSFGGISDSLLATIGSVTREGRRQHGPEDYFSLGPRHQLHRQEHLGWPGHRKKTVRFDSISDEYNESGNESWESGWMGVGDLRAGRLPPHPAFRGLGRPLLWDRQVRQGSGGGSWCIGEPGLGDPGLRDRHQQLLHLLGGQRQGEGQPAQEGRTGPPRPRDREHAAIPKVMVTEQVQFLDELKAARVRR